MGSSVMKDAWDEIERLSQNPKTVEIALSREFFLRDQLQREEDALNKGLKLGEEKGKEEGREEGREEGKEEVIFPMYELGMSVEKIAKVTGFSIERVGKIVKDRGEYSI